MHPCIRGLHWRRTHFWAPSHGDGRTWFLLGLCLDIILGPLLHAALHGTAHNMALAFERVPARQKPLCFIRALRSGIPWLLLESVHQGQSLGPTPTQGRSHTGCEHQEVGVGPLWELPAQGHEDVWPYHWLGKCSMMSLDSRSHCRQVSVVASSIKIVGSRKSLVLEVDVVVLQDQATHTEMVAESKFVVLKK